MKTEIQASSLPPIHFGAEIVGAYLTGFTGISVLAENQENYYVFNWDMISKDYDSFSVYPKVKIV